MKRFTDDQLLELLNDTESDRAERKESFKGSVPKKARQAVCAFSNDLPNYNQPGVLFIGAKDNGEPSREPITDQLLLTLADMKTDGNILPLPALSVEKRVLRGADMAVVTVMPSDIPPVKYEGRIWVRTGPRRSIANEQEERMLNERRRFNCLPYDLHPVSQATLKDLSRVFFEEEYLPKAFASDILAANGRSYEEHLSACRMIVSPDQPIPTVTGILTLGRKPQDFIPGARIQFLRIQGNEWGDEVIDELRIDGTLQHQLLSLDQKLMSHNRVAVEIVSAPTEIRHYRYPLGALQQLTRNTVMHRSYEGTNSPIMVYWFNDHIEIINAGGPFGRVSPENFGKAGYADYRNPTIAETMKTLGFVQRFGVGIQMAQRELATSGNPPAVFIVDNGSVLCRVSQSTNPRNTQRAPASKQTEPESGPESGPESRPESIKARVLSALQTDALSKSELAKAIGQKSVSGRLNQRIRELIVEELIEYTHPEKPNSRLQKYRITSSGRYHLENQA